MGRFRSSCPWLYFLADVASEASTNGSERHYNTLQGLWGDPQGPSVWLLAAGTASHSILSDLCGHGWHQAGGLCPSGRARHKRVHGEQIIL